MKGAASPTTAAADALVPAQHPFASHLRHAAAEESAHSLWTPDDGPLPSLYISHGAPPLFEVAGGLRELLGWASSMHNPRALIIVSAPG